MALLGVSCVYVCNVHVCGLEPVLTCASSFPILVEYVSIELDDPFGSDANDFDCLRMTHVSYALASYCAFNSVLSFYLTRYYSPLSWQAFFEDTYTTLLDVDGPEAADRLRLKMHVKSDEPLPQEQLWLMSSSA